MEIYQRGHVTVDENFARFGSKSYAINKITSVDVRVHEKRSIGWFFIGFVAVILGYAGVGALQAPEKGAAFKFLGIAALCMFLAVRGYRNRLSRTFELMLATAAGEVQATTGTDGDAIQELRDAIETRNCRQAMSRWALGVLALVPLLQSEIAFAHPGGLNSEGCHNNRKTGDYHCHRGSPRPAPSSRVQRLVGSGGGDAYYANCAAARVAGAAPVKRGDPGYGPHLDRDGDGVGCEPYRGR